DEVYVVAEFVRSHVGNEVEVIYGAGADNCAEDYLQVTLVATGFNERSYEQQTRTHIAEIRTDGTEVRMTSPALSEPASGAVRDTVPTLTAAPVAAPVEAAVPAEREERRVVTLDETPAVKTENKVVSAMNVAQAWFSDIDNAGHPASEPEVALAEAVEPSPVRMDVPVEGPVAMQTQEVDMALPVSPAMPEEILIPEAVRAELSAVAESVTPVAAEAPVMASAQAFAPWNGDRGFSAADLEAAGQGMQLVSRPDGYRAEGQPQSGRDVQTAVADMMPASSSYAQHPAYQDRMSRMRRFKEQLENNGLEYIEKVPAWKRKEMDLNPSVPAARSEMGDMMITPDGRITKNAYLRDNERVD
ncbi:MAG: hypothetical protein K2O01_02360, partial [Bacteroidales bacterium]|nr:hypothetical protein [Bacteroidales bacterium]